MPDITSLPVVNAPPVLSTPDIRILEEPLPQASSNNNYRTDEEIAEIYEVERVACEIVQGEWKRVALQFPDDLLVDAPRVSRALWKRINGTNHSPPDLQSAPKRAPRRIFILADTSYGACCVDEVAAQHADADVVVHYGRACLSPTARLPVIYCYTKQPLSSDAVVEAFCNNHPDHDQRTILMAHLPYQHVLPELFDKLQNLGYSHLFVAAPKQDPRSPLPNRTLPPSISEHDLHNWHLFHLSEPTPALLLTLTSRVRSISFLHTPCNGASTSQAALQADMDMALRRRYALLTSLSTTSVFGILVNTLSVRNYMEILTHVKDVIARAGKQSYTFVVGKVNAAKVANFSEVGGWVVIGCWESSLFDAKDFWKPIITPFELELALQRDNERLWTGRWTSDFQEVLDLSSASVTKANFSGPQCLAVQGESEAQVPYQSDDGVSDEESAPPEFDLRAGRYVSHSRPMGTSVPIRTCKTPADESESQALTRRGRADLTTVAGKVSPAADFFHNQRTWQGLGSDFPILERSKSMNSERAGATMEEGRHGIAKGYRVGDKLTER